MMVPGWVLWLSSSVLTGAGGLVLGLAAAVWRVVDMLPGCTGAGLLAVVAVALGAAAGWAWLDCTLGALPEAWLPERRG